MSPNIDMMIRERANLVQGSKESRQSLFATDPDRGRGRGDPGVSGTHSEIR